MRIRNQTPGPSQRQLQGFTLVELLVVIGIVALLIAILIPTLGTAREQAHRAGCLSNLRSLGHAMFQYAQRHRDQLPNSNLANTWDPNLGGRALLDLAANYTSPRVFYCPSDQDPEPDNITATVYFLENSAHLSYEFYPIWWSGRQGPMLMQLNGQAPLAWDIDGGEPKASPLQNHGTKGGNILFADGHAEWRAQKEWKGGNWPDPAKDFYPAP
jgi:prepilin-type N-terminal cleavage/methylation domain-containing protein/prepilin-type processing-associated H-X9-DG protein